MSARANMKRKRAQAWPAWTVALPMRAAAVRAARAVAVPAALAVWVACAAPARAEPPRAGTFDAGALRAAWSRHELRGLDGERITLASLRGQVVVLAFWASWCAPCRRELPELEALHAELEARGGRVLAVSIDHDAENARRFARRHRLSLPIYHDGPDGLARTLDLKHIPFTLVLDRNGAVAHTSAGADRGTLDALAAAVRRVAGSRPQTAAANPDGNP